LTKLTASLTIAATVNSLDATLAALADPTRRQVVDLLRRGPRRAGELAAATEMSGPAMSRHLRVLRSSGLVAVEGAEHDARLRVYTLRQEPFSALQAWVGQVHALWGDQLAAFKAHAERTRKKPPKP
jgi:DNA-binding transcriptional ArsR family regulator